ncbi:ABC transporter ATP-binding protein [Oscillibacter sp. MSJ-2]|uniref:ABC transporter ATP-binding protein n=1 Tax=Dysosmobacter acutus TaxID=2841504 RepID=A0ABS6FB94_9FIRM|nr:ABC transporter ATP-binding protein [Dysosmobacter acutus]MBU5626635.1 ABC transporter ATP-binding protein [Dysosmobacter acutus]
MELLKMKGITKEFPGVIANADVDLTVEEGQIHALLGENGAGKTTLMNILFGLYQADRGEIFWKGEPVRFRTPGEAILHGIGMVHQHFMLVRNMTVLQNIVLGLKPEGYPFLDTKKIAAQLSEVSQRYGLIVDVNKKIEQLSVGEQQRVEILKALYRNAKLLVLDEPTAVLTPQETRELFAILRSLKADGHSIILISHHLAEIMEVSDRITVLRDGRNVATVETGACTESQLSQMMIGRELHTDTVERTAMEPGEATLSIRGLSLSGSRGTPLLDGIDLEVRRGEIVGVAGVDGNGQGYLAETICGIRRQSGGSILYQGKDIAKSGIRERFRMGISYIPDDRHRDGLVLDADVKDNLLLRSYYAAPNAKHGIFQRRQIESSTAAAMEKYDVRAPGLSARVGNLSGGNQQKIILAREIGVEPQLLIAMQPTRGLDIGASEYVHEQLIACRNSGKSVLLISTDLEEIMKMSDRIAVIFSGKIMGVLKNTPDLSVETIGLLMGGHKLEEVRA